MVTREQACILLDIIECATESMSGWLITRDGLMKMGYNGKEIEEAVGALGKLAHRSNPISAGDF